MKALKKISLKILETLTARVLLCPLVPFMGVAAFVTVLGICIIIGFLMIEPILPTA